MARTKKSIRAETIKNMKALGTYKPEYNNVIDIFVGMLHQYENFQAEFERSGYKIEEEYTNKAGATNMRKTPLFSAMEKLRMDIATYSDKLGLNPKALESITTESANKSKLASVLSKLE